MSKKVWKVKKKKKHKGWIIFGVLMTIFVVFPVAFVFGAFYDTSTKNVSDSDTHYENIVAETFYKGLENLSDSGELKFTINEEMIDGIMMGACDKINQKKFIPKMYCDIDGNNYNFYIDLQALFFKTRVILRTTLTGTETELLTFKIGGITIGRLPLPISWVTGIAGNFINDDMLNNIFKETGFRIESHLAEAKLTYKREYLKNDIGAFVEKLGDNNEYLGLLLDVINAGKIFSAEYYNGISAIIDLSKLVIKDKYNPPLTFDSEQLGRHKENIAKWLNEGLLKEPNVASVFSYLIRGYNRTSDAFITNLESTDLLYKAIETYVAPEKFDEWKGSTITDTSLEEMQFEDYCGAEQNVGITIDPNPEEIILPITDLSVTLNSDFLNKYLAYTMTDAIGKTIPITYKDENEWKFEYIFVDNFFVDFEEDKTEGDDHKMNMYLSLNVSGYPICLKLVNHNITINANDSDLSLDFTLDTGKFIFGDITITDFGILNSVLKMLPEEGDFKYDTTNNTFSVDVGKYITGDYKTQIINFIAQHVEDVTKTVSGSNLELSYSNP